MSQFSLNIYGENDEIIKAYETDFVRWGVFLQAIDLQEKLEESEATASEQFKAINDFVKKIFPGLTDDELEKASWDDVFNTFKQVTRKAKAIGGSKN